MPWGSLGPMPLGEVPRLPFLCPLQASKCRSQASRDSSTGHLEVRQDSQSFPHRSWKGRMGFKVAGSQGREHTWMRLPLHPPTHTQGLLVLEMRKPGPSNNQRKWASQQSIVTCPARPPPPLPLPTMRLHQPCTWALRAEGLSTLSATHPPTEPRGNQERSTTWKAKTGPPRESKKSPRSHSLSVAKLHPMLETALTRPHQAPQLSKLRTDTLMTSRGERPLLSIEDQGSWGSRLSQLPQPISSQIELTESAKGQRSQGHLDPWYTE